MGPAIVELKEHAPEVAGLDPEVQMMLDRTVTWLGVVGHMIPPATVLLAPASAIVEKATEPIE